MFWVMAVVSAGLFLVALQSGLEGRVDEAWGAVVFALVTFGGALCATQERRGER